jgi:hypothetical protein
MTSLANANRSQRLACRIVGEHAVAGVCHGCNADLGAAGRVLLPDGGGGPLRALCGPCLGGDPEAQAAVAAGRALDFVGAFLLHLVAAGCQPRAVEREAAA